MNIRASKTGGEFTIKHLTFGGAGAFFLRLDAAIGVLGLCIGSVVGVAK